MSGMKRWQHLKIPFKEIEIATKNFKKPIGKGGFGVVYEGYLSIQGKYTKVAVKRLNEQFGQGLKEFLTEIELLCGQIHPNLITLVGYCNEIKEKIIVYEFAERGSLDHHIRRRNSSLTWLKRLQICIDASRGLDYLHNHVGKHQTIIHRDIKSANILIDEKWVGKISDLGLSKLCLADLDRSLVISHACGTAAYVEPESVSTGIVTKESDVYSFGVVLFEVLCGRLCLVKDDHDGIRFSGRLAKDYYKKKKLEEIIDPSLRKQMSVESMNKFAEIAYTCLLEDREHRPSMDRVTKELEESLKIQMQDEEIKRFKNLSVLHEEDINDDLYWEKKLPKDYQNYIQHADTPLRYANKMELYYRLCEGFLRDNGQLWFSICKSSGGICSMLPTTQILCEDTEYDRLDTLTLPESRFHEVRKLGYASCYILTCRFQSLMISPRTTYACYLVFKLEDNHKQPNDNRLFTAEYGLGYLFLGKVLAHMCLLTKNKQTINTTDYDTKYDLESWMEERKDGWMEIMLSNPLQNLEDNSTVKIRLSKLVGSFRGIIVEGIEFRPYINASSSY